MPDPTPQQRLIEMAGGIIATQAIHTAAELGIPDALAAGPKPADTVAATVGANPDALFRLMRTLAGLGVFTQSADATFGLTPIGECLRSDHPSKMRDYARMMGEDLARAWLELPHTVRTGECAFDRAVGKPFFDYLRDHPDRARVFDGAMTGVHGPETAPMLDAYDFSGFACVVDVGGGNGSTLLELLRRFEAPRGIVFDLPDVAAHAADVLGASDCAARVSAEGGNFFEAVPTGADCYLLRHIVHDWDDDRAVTILERCRDAVADGGRIVVVESVVPPGGEPHPSKILDLIMLAVPGGRERTAEEYDALFARAGLRIERIVPTASPISVIEGVRA